ncbi:MAG: LCP family protein [Candidatus Roizmanbacteria bacterium]
MKKGSPHVWLFVALVLITVGSIGFILFTSQNRSSISFPIRAFVVAPSPTPTPYFHNIALLGYGGGDHEGGALTDSMIVARINDRDKKISLISIPRDTWIPLPLEKGGAMVNQKINAAYAYGLDDTTYPGKQDIYKSKNGGGLALAKYALSSVIGEPIEHSVSVSFASFTALVDQLGGISVTRSFPFLDEWYPIDGKEKELCNHTVEDLPALTATLSGRLLEQEFPCRYEKLQLPTGTTTLNGQMALKYARSRKSDNEGGDFYRSQHQKQVIEGIKEKALSLNSFPGLVRIATSIGKYIDTDYSLTDLAGIIKEYMRKKDHTIESIALSNENVFIESSGPQGQYILEPIGGKKEWNDIHEYLQSRYSGMSDASASAQVKMKYVPTPTPSVPFRKVTSAVAR